MTWWHDEEGPAPQRGPLPEDPPTLPPRYEPTAVWVPHETMPGSGGAGRPPPPPRGGGGWPPAGPPPSHRRRRRRGGLFAVVAAGSVAALLAAAVAFASGGGSGLFPSDSIGRTNPPANPVSQQKLDPAQIATTTDPAIVDVTATLGFQNGEAAGTGMVLTSNGEILTNNHVIADASSLSVKISNRSQTYPAKLVGTDTTDDVAVIQAEGVSGLATVPLGNSANVTVGDAVVAIGNALNKPGPPTVTQGNITALGRSINVRGDFGDSEALSNLIEHNAQLEPGNSGGPLFDATGKVIGMNTAAASGAIPTSGTDAGTNDGFAIPIGDALTIVHQIEGGKSGGNVNVGTPAFLGVEVQNAGNGGFNDGSGPTVAGVQAGSPASSAGLVTGDEITAVDGTSVTTSQQLTQLIHSKHPGDTVRITWVDQSGQQQSASVRLASRSAG